MNCDKKSVAVFIKAATGSVCVYQSESHLTRNVVISRYGVDCIKVNVSYNAIEMNEQKMLGNTHNPTINKNEESCYF